jgi:hypothetical protein
LALKIRVFSALLMSPGSKQSDRDVFGFLLGAGFRDAGRRKSKVGITWSGKSRSSEDPTDGESNQGFHLGAFFYLGFFLSPSGKFRGNSPGSNRLKAAQTKNPRKLWS